METKDNIKLPPLHYDELPEADDAIPAMHNYARKAIKADRQRRSVPVACHRCAEYAKELQALRKDKERLDWLACPNNNIGNVQLPRVCVERNLHSLRDAIDCAMEQRK